MKRKQKIKYWMFSARGVAFLFLFNLFLVLALGILFLNDMAGKTKAQLIQPSVIRTKVMVNGNASSVSEPFFKISKLVSSSQDTSLSTKIYPGYTMSFDVAVVSSSNVENPTFIYSILNGQGEEVHHSSEQEDVSGKNVFTKKITLPQDLPLGKYKLRVEAIVGDSKTIQEQYFHVEESPMANFQSNIKEKSTLLVARAGLIIIFFVFIVSLIVFLIVIKRQKHSTKFGFLKN